VLGALVFLSPRGGLVAFAVVLPVAAAVIAALRQARTRNTLALDPPGGQNILELACLAAVPLLLALAATGPALRSAAGRGILNDAQAVFVFDTSRSMGAAAGTHAPSRLDQAKAAAAELRAAVPDVRVGISSITTQLVPELFPSADDVAFAGTLRESIGVLKPPPPAFALVATTYDPLAALRDQGFFSPSAKHRVAVLFSDGESIKFFPTYLGKRLSAPIPPGAIGFGGGGGGGFGALQKPQAPVKLIVLKFGSAKDHVYHPDGSIDPGYRADPGAESTAAELAQDAGGLLFHGNQIPAAERALRSEFGAGPRSVRVTPMRTRKLAVDVALASLLPLGFLLWRRNFIAL
jgi:hypothetical protein